MRRRSKNIGILTAAVLVALIFAGCGESNDLIAAQAEDQAIRSAMNEPGGLQGDKLAVYDEGEDLYFYTAAFLPEKLRARTPEEIGAFLCLHKSDGKYVDGVSLRGMFSKKEFFLASLKFPTERKQLDKYTDVIDAQFQYNDGEHGSPQNKVFLYRYLEQHVPQLFQEKQAQDEDEAIRSALKKAGGLQGDKLAVYDVKTDRYSFTGAYLPDDLRAGTPEEIGAFLCLQESGTNTVALWLKTASSIGKNSSRYTAKCTLEMLDGQTELYIGTNSVNRRTLTDYLERTTPKLLRLEKEDLIIRSAMKESGGLQGVKAAIYDVREDLYSFTGAELPEEFRAGSPEEIGVFLCIDTRNPSESRVFLKGAFSKAEEYSTDYVIASRIFDAEDIDRNTSVKRSGSAGNFCSLMIYLQENMPIVLKHEEAGITAAKKTALVNLLNNPSQTEEFTEGGIYFVGYDKDTGKYTMDRIPGSLEGTGVDDVGYILSFSSSWGQKTGEYIGSIKYTFDVECFSADILVASTGKKLASFQIDKKPPGSVMLINGYPSSLKESVEIWEIADKIKEIFKKQKLGWPYEEGSSFPRYHE